MAELGAEISRDYAGRDLFMMGVLKGAVFFVADLMRQIDVPCELDFMAVSSYGSLTDSSGVVRILKDLDSSIEGKDVLIVEDIVDSGLTLNYLLRNLRAPRPAFARGVRAAGEAGAPQDRAADPLRRVRDPEPFVVGYGLDLDQRYRNLPYVAALDADRRAGDGMHAVGDVAQRAGRKAA